MEITDVPYAVLRFPVPARPVPASVNRGAGGRWDEFGSPYPDCSMSAGWEGWTRPSAKCWATRTWRSVVPRSSSADALRRAAQLDATATQNQEQADDELKAKRDKAIEDQKDARAVTEREVEEARTAAEERKGAAAEAAQKRTAAAKQQADELAAQLRGRPKRPSARSRPRHRGRAEGHRGCGVQAGRCSGKTQRLPASAHRRTR